mgnify:CR=1 FL=1
MEYPLEDLFMKSTTQGVFQGYDEGDLDLLIMTWLANKGRDFPEADRHYYKLAEQVSRWRGVLPQVKR